MLQALCSILKCAGTRIASATTVREARHRILEDEPYDAIICEQHLSDGAGLEFLGWLRWQQHVPTPFLLIARSDRFVMDCHQQFSILAQPFRVDELLASVRRLLRSQSCGVIASQIPFAGELKRQS